MKMEKIIQSFLGLVTSFIFLLSGHVTDASYCFYSYYYRYYYCYYYYSYGSAGTIAGAVVGAIIGVAILVGIVIFICVAMKGKTRGMRGTVIRPQPNVTVVSTNQYANPSMPAPPPPYTQQGNAYPPPSYPPPPPAQMGYGHPPPAYNPAYPPPQ